MSSDFAFMPSTYATDLNTTLSNSVEGSSFLTANQTNSNLVDPLLSNQTKFSSSSSDPVLEPLSSVDQPTNATFIANFVLVGDQGNNGFLAGFGNTLFDGQAGIDVVDYTPVNQRITLGARGFVDKGTAGVDQLISIERIIAPAGFANLLDGSTANGTGTWMNVNLATSSLDVNVSPNLTIDLTIQNFVDVIGTTQNDIIVGNSANNFLAGGAGSDILRGGGGFDTLVGGAGTDYFVLGDATTIDGLGTSFVTITDWNAAADFIVTGGNPNAYSLFFTDVSGSFSLDTVILFGNTPIAVIQDTTNVNIARDFRFVTPGFNTVVTGTLGNDVFTGGFGNMVFDAGSGLDIVNYSNLNQPISLGARGVVEKGMAGVDQLVNVESIIAPVGFANVIDGATANGTGASMDVNLATNSLVVNVAPGFSINLAVQNFVNVIGTSQADTIIGNTANNILQGGAGNDILRGGGGFDTLVGGTGTDYFVLGDAFTLDGLGTGFATITDWNPAADFIVTGGNPNAYSLSFINVSGSALLDTVISFGNDTIAVIEDTTNVNFVRDFIFV